MRLGQKHSILGLSTSMLCVLVLVACGSSKSDNTSPPPPAAAPAPQQPPKAPTAPGDVSVPGDGSTGSDSTADDSQENDQSDGKTVCERRAKQGGQELNSLLAKAAKYTSAAGVNDHLREDLFADLLCTKKESKLQNLKLATMVDRANLMIDESGEVLVNIHMKGDRPEQKQKVSLVGNLGERNQSGQAGLISTGQASQGNASAQGTIECMDINGGCRTVLVEVRMGKAQSKSKSALRKVPKMQILFRQTNFKFDPILGSAEAGSAAYSKLVDLMLNYRKKVRSSSYYTYEVIGGKSGFRVIVMSRQNQMLIFEGDLIDQDVAFSTRPKLRAKQDIKETAEFFGAGRQADMGLMGLLLDPRLVDTDNQGHISIEFKTASDRRGTSVIFGAEHYGLTPVREGVRLTND